MTGLVEAQLAAIEEVRRFTDYSRQIRLVGVDELGESAALELEIKTSEFTHHPGGLPVGSHERVTAFVGPHHPLVPPLAVVKHLRWAGCPHVLQGERLCVYLDPNTEWDPSRGMQGFLGRLWSWFDDAIGNRFDAAGALYHPVGGVLHRTQGAPTVVVVEPMPAALISEGIVRRIGLRPRTDYRVDIAAWNTPYSPDLVPGLLVALPACLPMGGGHQLSDLVATVRQQLDRKERRTLETGVRRILLDLDDTNHLHVVIAVPNPANGDGADRYLIGWRLGAKDAARALAAVRSSAAKGTASNEPQVEWTYVDDQRPEVAVRRDNERPVSVYAGSKVAVWGCGALGSWIAEQLVRAGVRSVTLRDPGFVTHGLLVRQNYTEEDVGRPKAEALAERLRSLSDTCEVYGVVCCAEAGLGEDAADCDLIFDTSVNTSVNAAIVSAQKNGNLSVPVVQVATDNQSATLGIVTVTDRTSTTTTADLDQALGNKVLEAKSLTAFRTFWDHDHHPPLTPAPGCSIPTFHGSSADAMSIAACALSIAATALARQIAGGYLISLSYSPFGMPPLTHVQS